MPDISASRLIDAPADAVWALLADFGGIETWWPKEGPIVIERVELEGSGVGMIRHIQNRGFPVPISERLDLIDHEAKRLIMSIVGEMPMSLTAYVAMATITAVDANHCQMDYRSYLTGTGDPDKLIGSLRSTYEYMFNGLAESSR